MSATSGENGFARHLRSVPLPAEVDELREAGDAFADRCRCTTTILSPPPGDVVVLDVCGELDALTLPDVADAFHAALGLPAVHLVVDLTGLRFCSVRGVQLFVDARAHAARCGIGFSVSGASWQVRRLWSLLWPADEQPIPFPDLAGAVADALSPRSVLHLARAGDPAGRPVVHLAAERDGPG